MQEVYKLDKYRLEQAARLIIEGIGENPKRQGLIETPQRFAKMLMEQLEYADVSNEEIAKKFDKCFDSGDNNMVVVKDITVFSHCEHHIALMYDMSVSVGYIPKGRVIGLSKVARIAEAVCKRLQIQERIGTDIIDILKKILGTDDIIVLIEGKHSCMTARGINKPNSVTRTVTCSGCFFKHSPKAEFLAAIK